MGRYCSFAFSHRYILMDIQRNSLEVCSCPHTIMAYKSALTGNRNHLPSQVKKTTAAWSALLRVTTDQTHQQRIEPIDLHPAPWNPFTTSYHQIWQSPEAMRYEIALKFEGCLGNTAAVACHISKHTPFTPNLLASRHFVGRRLTAWVSALTTHFENGVLNIYGTHCKHNY